jgi:hypothetical protein
VDLTGRFDEELVEVLPKSVRFVCHNGKSHYFHHLSSSSGSGTSLPYLPCQYVSSLEEFLSPEEFLQPDHISGPSS